VSYGEAQHVVNVCRAQKYVVAVVLNLCCFNGFRCGDETLDISAGKIPLKMYNSTFCDKVALSWLNQTFQHNHRNLEVVQCSQVYKKCACVVTGRIFMCFV
jgi:hypothetical protein